jgi:hypothetical protein
MLLISANMETATNKEKVSLTQRGVSLTNEHKSDFN